MHYVFKRLLVIIKTVYTPVSLLCVSYFFWVKRGLIENIFANANGAFLFYAILSWSFLHLLSPLGPKIVFSNLGSMSTYRQLLSIHIRQIPARYLPGGVWHTVGRMTAYHLSGISKKEIAVYAVIETIAPCIVTLLLGGAILYFSSGSQDYQYLYGTIALIQLCIILFLPLVMKFRRAFHFTAKIRLSYGAYFLVGVFFWLIATCSFLFYYHAFSISPITGFGTELFNIIGSYLFSWGIGYIAVFAPQGIGVFEVVAGKLIELPMDLGGSVVFIAGFRLVSFAADIGVWCLYNSFIMLNRPGKTKNPATQH